MDKRKELSWPQLFIRAATRPFDYKSKASRAEYWVFCLGELGLLLFLQMAQWTLWQMQIVLINQLYFGEGEGFEIAGLAANLVGVLVSTASMAHLFALIYSWIVNTSLTNRRLRDLKMNTWLTPVFMIPVLNLILALIFFTRKSSEMEAS